MFGRSTSARFKTERRTAPGPGDYDAPTTLTTKGVGTFGTEQKAVNACIPPATRTEVGENACSLDAQLYCYYYY